MTTQQPKPALIRTNVCKTSFWATDAETGLRFGKVYTNAEGTRTNSPRLERFAALMMAGPELFDFVETAAMGNTDPERLETLARELLESLNLPA